MPSAVKMIDLFPERIAQANAGTHATIKETGEKMRQIAFDLSRYDTGKMREGWATQFHPSANEPFLVLYNPVEYTFFNEYGTVYMDAAPMARPAAEMVGDDYIKGLRRSWFGLY